MTKCLLYFHLQANFLLRLHLLDTLLMNLWEDTRTFLQGSTPVFPQVFSQVFHVSHAFCSQRSNETFSLYELNRNKNDVILTEHLNTHSNNSWLNRNMPLQNNPPIFSVLKLQVSDAKMQSKNQTQPLNTAIWGLFCYCYH